jgi:UDP-N-acetylmuramate: L-alanyl-gamma-D-glutamyl-meso-diaminopimelate ligase
MGAAACLLQEAGYEISGADLSFSPPMSTYLESTGIECLALDEMTDEKLNDYDLIIVGNSVPRHSDYAKQIERCGVKFTSFPEIIGKAILKNKKVIGVAGTHGKTTTTYFMTQMLEKLNQKPGYLIGGILDDAPPSRLGEKYFVIESDEYDSAYFQKISKFRLYEINQLLLTSLEFDHADIFDTVEDIEAEFEEAFKGGIVSVTADATYPSIQKLAKKYASKNWQLYNDGKSPTIIEESSTKTIFSVQLGDETSTFETNVIGFHNILNITACIKLLYQEGFRTADLSQAVSTLGLVKRRQEYRGLYKDAVVIDDFAHHPRAISLTIDAIRQKISG